MATHSQLQFNGWHDKLLPTFDNSIASMESDPKKFLSRLDIINTLKSRHLHIPNMENLTYEELLRIFKTFAVPLEKRRERERYIPTQYWNYVPDDRLASFPFDLSPIQSATDAQKFIEEHEIIPQHTPHILQHAKFLKLSFNTISNQAPKRYSMHGQDMPGGPTPPKRLMTLP